MHCVRLQLKELNHDNIKSFVGACVEPGHICYIMQLCSRGTVQVCTYKYHVLCCMLVSNNEKIYSLCITFSLYIFLEFVDYAEYTNKGEVLYYRRPFLSKFLR